MPDGRLYDYDAIVVGAGPAGSTAGLYLARSGLRVAMLERGPYPGSKSLSGSGLVSLQISEIVPGLWAEAPIERAIVEQQFWILNEDSALRLGFRSARFARPPYNRLSVQRASFDRWYALQAEKAGASLHSSSLVQNVLSLSGQVEGVRLADGRELRAPAVILAEGALPTVAIRAGLIPRPKTKDIALWAKETIVLDARMIEERFGVGPGQGVAIGLYGAATKGLPGAAALYTHRETVSLAVGVLLSHLAKNKTTPHELIEDLKAHPALVPLLAGGRTVEYSAHLIPEGGYNAVPKIDHPGCLIAGDAAGLVNGVQGVNLAMTSGLMAAETVIEAHRKGDFSARTMRGYRERLNGTTIMRDFKSNRRAARFYAEHPYVFRVYPELLTEGSYRIANVGLLEKLAKRREIIRWGFRQRGLGRILADAIAAYRAWR